MFDIGQVDIWSGRAEGAPTHPKRGEALVSGSCPFAAAGTKRPEHQKQPMLGIQFSRLEVKKWRIVAQVDGMWETSKLSAANANRHCVGL